MDRQARFLSMQEAADYLGNISAETLFRLAREGHLPVKRIGRRTVISERRLDEWANQPGDARATDYPGVAIDRSRA
jgi:excisionase family DNA binding protein